MKPVVVRNIKRVDKKTLGDFSAFGVSTVHEAMGRSGLMKTYMRPIYPGARIGARTPARRRDDQRENSPRGPRSGMLRAGSGTRRHLPRCLHVHWRPTWLRSPSIRL